MCEEMVKKIYHISKKCDTSEISILTNHLKFKGTLCTLSECEKKEKGDCILTITNARMWRVEDICICGCKDCKCNENNYVSADWLNINVNKIVAFTFKKE